VNLQHLHKKFTNAFPTIIAGIYLLSNIIYLFFIKLNTIRSSNHHLTTIQKMLWLGLIEHYIEVY